MRISENYLHETEQARKLLARLRADLEKYASRTDASADAIAARDEIIIRLEQFILAADANAIEMSKRGTRQYAAGYAAGAQAKEKELTGPPDKWTNKEGHRAHSIQKAKERWPELY